MEERKINSPWTMQPVQLMNRDPVLLSVLGGAAGGGKTMAHSNAVEQAVLRKTLVNRGFTEDEVGTMSDVTVIKTVNAISRTGEDRVDAMAYAMHGFDLAKQPGEDLNRRPRVGDTIDLGGHRYRVRKITQKDVVIREVK